MFMKSLKKYGSSDVKHGFYMNFCLFFIDIDLYKEGDQIHGYTVKQVIC